MDTQEIKRHVNIAAPNLLSVCVDTHRQGEASGRMFHRFSREPEQFRDSGHLLKQMEALFDRIGYPQAATRRRSFFPQPEVYQQKGEVARVMEADEIIGQRGEKGTFIVHVQYRQNATWQGNVTWVDRGVTQNFRSALELLKLIDGALDSAEE